MVTNRASGRRIYYAKRKLRAAQLRLARTERSIFYWSRILANLRQKRTRVLQPPPWPEAEAKD